ncbi:MAG: hypothetical protein ACOX9C_03705 [Kiritimatiellia bacterium]
MGPKSVLDFAPAPPFGKTTFIVRDSGTISTLPSRKALGLPGWFRSLKSTRSSEGINRGRACPANAEVNNIGAIMIQPQKLFFIVEPSSV